jgi:hypothetical protein
MAADAPAMLGRQSSRSSENTTSPRNLEPAAVGRRCDGSCCAAPEPRTHGPRSSRVEASKGPATLERGALRYPSSRPGLTPEAELRQPPSAANAERPTFRPSLSEPPHGPRRICAAAARLEPDTSFGASSAESRSSSRRDGKLTKVSRETMPHPAARAARNACERLGAEMQTIHPTSPSGRDEPRTLSNRSPIPFAARRRQRPLESGSSTNRVPPAGAVYGSTAGCGSGEARPSRRRPPNLERAARPSRPSKGSRTDQRARRR